MLRRPPNMIPPSTAFTVQSSQMAGRHASLIVVQTSASLLFNLNPSEGNYLHVCFLSKSCEIVVLVNRGRH